MRMKALLLATLLVSLVAFNLRTTAQTSLMDAPAAGGASVKGTVKFDGKAPLLRPIDMTGADPKCGALHKEAIKPETVVVNGNGTLRYVLIYVKAGAKAAEAPEGDVLLDQKGCMYAPHVIGVQKGQTLRIKTSDPTAHNVHGFGKKTFNVSQPEGAADVTVKMKKDEYPPFKVKCDIHPWMEAWVGVFEHPYFAVTGEDGSFTLKGLPAGKYTIGAWHEKYGEQSQEVTLAEAETKEMTFTFQGK